MVVKKTKERRRRREISKRRDTMEILIVKMMIST